LGENHKLYVPTHPGQVGAKRLKDYVVPVEDGSGGMSPAFLVGNLLEKNMAPIIGGGLNQDYATSLTVPGWTVVTGGTGDATANAVTAGGGLLMTLASDDNFDMTLDAVGAVTLAEKKWYHLAARIQVSNATGIGFKIGLTTGGSAAALPFGTNYTDVVAFSKPIASAAMVGTCRGDSGTAADTATLATIVAATEVEIGFAFYIDSTSATTSRGYWVVNDTVTGMSAAQIAQIDKLMDDGTQTMYWTIHGTGVTATNPTMTITSLIAGNDK
jgi:hypothetical protein